MPPPFPILRSHATIMPREFCGPCGIVHATPVDTHCTRQPSGIQLRHSTRKQQDMAEASKQIKSEKLGDKATTLLEVRPLSDEALSDDKSALVEKLQQLEKKKRQVVLEKKVWQLESEISRMSISDEQLAREEEESANAGQERMSRGRDRHQELSGSSSSMNNSPPFRRSIHRQHLLW